ncbi:hypothetical protein BX616_004443 [Lobosporangium transversale]|uniref:Domain of unknown function at the cortex 1 domain-containing protein n=1 Tax=Lobosporangium transversale TaxID=64571 RepID=A0A1Y2H5A5_9FUNG|nr:hypothetical protein BCR41DRAFT_316378 [Lobosporangium transversale]KAF9916172.1 hypothetical protein BX616_004443 [Lobosporangium transversale]ORZ28893.1 hypothetical protein BCR41DRAFT_316378 [Lobosporangium transversale]|eukprot:XP_021886566.1 hypothetical protein BCR41DRAFT_316378 [Lobosporangium transversale]
MVKLRVKVGGTYTDLAIINCNDEFHPIEFDAPEFKGRAVVRIKDFVGITNDGSEPIYNSEYFKGRNRRFSIQVEGRFKREWDGQQVYFGTDFDRPVELPDGFEMMLKVARYIDPVVKASFTKDGKPWVLSPLVSSINTMSAWRHGDAKPPSPPLTPRPSMDISRAFSMSENSVTGAVSSAWGFLGKFKRGNRSSVMSISSTASNNDSNNGSSYGISRSASSDQVDKLRQNSGQTLPVPVPSITSPPTPQPESLSSSANSADWDANKELKKIAAAVDDSELPLGEWRQHVEEDTTFFLPGQASLTTAQRRKYFQTEQSRKDFTYNKDLVYGFEFFSPHMDFNTFDIRLGLSMNIRKYLAEQPVRYTCRTLDGSTVFWAVQFELVDDE